MTRTGSHNLTIDYTRICQWLGLPAGPWPPDHYTLLGLERGETDPRRIEAMAHQRLKLVRCYQISHPDLATAAMNRMAEAFACLCDANAKRQYDAEFGFVARDQPLSVPNGDTSVANKSAANDTVSDGLPTVVVWTAAVSPPPRGSNPALAETCPDPPAAPLEIPDEAPGAAAQVAAVPTPEMDVEPSSSSVPAPSPPAAPVDPVLAAAQKSWRAWKGMWGKAALQQRLIHTRTLLQTWLRLARYVNPGKGPLAAGQHQNFRGMLARIEILREDLPLLLGEPGQPGYRVSILARDEDPVAAFRQMDAAERLALAQDWKKSAALLQAHAQFLEAELGELYQESRVTRWFRPVRGFLVANAGWVLAVLLGSLVLIGILAKATM